MKRLFSILAIAGMMAFGTVNANTNAITTSSATTVATTIQDADAAAEPELGFTQELKKQLKNKKNDATILKIYVYLGETNEEFFNAFYNCIPFNRFC